MASVTAFISGVIRGGSSLTRPTKTGITNGSAASNPLRGYSFFEVVITVDEVVGRRTGRSSRVEFPIRQGYQNRREIPAAVEVVTVLLRHPSGSSILVEQHELPERFRPLDELSALRRPPEPSRFEPCAGSDSRSLILSQSGQELALARPQGPEHERGVVCAEHAAEPAPLLEPLLVGRGVLEREDDAERVDGVVRVERPDPQEVAPGFLPGNTQ